MAQQVRAPDALAEGWDWIPRTHRAVYNCLWLQFQRFWCFLLASTGTAHMQAGKILKSHKGKMNKLFLTISSFCGEYFPPETLLTWLDWESNNTMYYTWQGDSRIQPILLCMNLFFKSTSFLLSHSPFLPICFLCLRLSMSLFFSLLWVI